MFGQPVQIYTPLLRPRSSITVIDKIVEKTCGFASPVKNAGNYIPRRYVSVWKDHGGSCQSVTYILQLLGFVINLNSSSENRIFGNDNQFQRNHFIAAETENELWKWDVSEFSQKLQNNSIAVYETVRLFGLNNFGDASCQATVPISAAGINKGSSIEKLLPNNNEIRFTCYRRTTVVINNVSLSKERSLTLQTDASKTSWVLSDYCLTTVGIWCSMKKNSGTESNLFDRTDFHKRSKNTTLHHQVDNKSTLKYLLKMGKTQKLELKKIFKEIWTFLLTKNIPITGEYLPGKLNYVAQHATW